MNLPIMNLHERVLGVLGCRYVDDVLIDAPYTISRDMITILRIDEVIYPYFANEQISHSDISRFQVAIELGILKHIPVEATFRMEFLVHRIQSNAAAIQTKFERKAVAEEAYMDSLRSSNP